MELRGKTAVITGAGSGIGRALAQQLNEEGAALAICDVDKTGLEETVASLESGAKVYHKLVDMADRKAVYAFKDEAIANLDAVDLVINNAGVALGRVSLKDIKQEDFEWLMNINFWGMVYGTQAFLPHLVERREACVANVSSVFGIIGVAYQGAYCSSKFAIRGYTESLRMEMKALHPNVTISSIHPGGIKTNIAKNSKWVGDFTEKEIENQVKQFEKSFRTSPEQAANQIIKGIRKGNERILVGNDAVLIDRMQRWMPIKYTKLVLQFFKKNFENGKK